MGELFGIFGQFFGHKKIFGHLFLAIFGHLWGVFLALVGVFFEILAKNPFFFLIFQIFQI